MSLILLFLATFLFQFEAGEGVELDNNQFLIYNKIYHKARLTLFQNKKVGSYEHGLYADQLWTLEPNPYRRDCYYLVNEYHPQYRLADHKHRMISYNGHRYADQLFRFVPSGGYYYIYNCHYTNDRIAKWGHENHKTGMYGGPKYPDQLWKLVPRFKAQFFTDEVFHFDNRQGSKPITKEISVTRGVKISSTTSIRRKTTFRQSIEASLSAAIKIFNFGVTSKTEFSDELQTSISRNTEESWSRTDKITFVIPPGKNFKVMQHVVRFDGKFSAESCKLHSAIKIFESDTSQFDDPDNFIITKTQ